MNERASSAARHPGHSRVVQQDMRRWLERAVIGLNLCPFAKAVHVKGQIHYAVSAAQRRRRRCSRI